MKKHRQNEFFEHENGAAFLHPWRDARVELGVVGRKKGPP
jgi:hypothetical protein